MNARRTIGAVLLFLGSASPALAHFTKLDDFQREPGTNMGPDWVENRLDFSIAAVQGLGEVAQAIDHAFMIYTGDLQGLSPEDDWFTVAAINNREMTPQYVALVLRHDPADSANSVLVKIQDNDGDNFFDYIFFYRGVSPSKPWAGMTGGSFAQAIAPTDEITMRVRVADDYSHPGMLQVIVELDGNHNGLWGEPEDDVFARGNLDPEGLGTQVGLAGTGGAMADDFGGEVVPEPASLALAIVGGTVLAGRRKRRG